MFEKTKEKKRFIAGAVCPECKRTDTIIMYPDRLTVACVSCDYKEVMNDDSSTPSQAAAEPDVAAVRFVDATAPKS